MKDIQVNAELQRLKQYAQDEARLQQKRRATDELIEALEAILDDADPTGCDGCAVVSNTVLERGRAVLAKAKGKKS